jgi:hypothetical protein
MVHNPAVAVQVFNVAHQDQFEKHDRVNALVPLGSVVFLCGLPKKTQIKLFAKLAVKVVFRDMITQPEVVKQLFCVFFFTLHFCFGMTNTKLNVAKDATASLNIFFNYFW